MKILHVIPSISPRRGGPSFLLRALAAGLARAGHEVHVATTDDDGPGRLNPPPPSHRLEEGVQIWTFPRQIRFYTVSWPLWRWLSRRAADFDVVHAHALFTFPSLAAAFWAKRRRTPYVVRPLGTLNRWGVRNRRPWLKRLSFPLVERRILENAACVHYTSEAEFEEARQLGFAAPAAVIPNGFDPAQIEGGVAERFLGLHPGLSDRPRILFLSRLDPKKGLDLLLDAFAGLSDRQPAPALVLAGNGENAFVETVRRQAEDLGVSGRVHFVGFLKDDQKRDALAAADVYVLPSYSENFGIAAAEALACGLPVVISDQVAIHREVAEAGAGWVVPCRASDLTEALREALDQGRGPDRAARARALALDRFSMESVIGRLERLYREIVQSELLPVLVLMLVLMLGPLLPAKRGGMFWSTSTSTSTSTGTG